MKECITVTYACDDNYSRHLAVSIASLIDNYSMSKRLDIFVFDAGISKENRGKIQKLERNNIGIKFVQIDVNMFDGYPLTIEHISLATYFRLKLPSLLPSHKKVVYFDVDIIINDDISKMWDVSLEGKSIAAVIEPEVSLNNKEHLRCIGVDGDFFYFNAGVLILDLDRLRRLNFEGKVIDYLGKYSSLLVYQDQDILNGMLFNDVKYLSPFYNYMPMYRNILSKKRRYQINLIPYTELEIKKLKKTACVYHFCGRRKAWMQSCTSSGFHLYKKYQHKTEWRDADYTDLEQIKGLVKANYIYRRFILRLMNFLS
ncbi:glycosyltransferase family 8 protein [Vibrio algicola]|uniref:Glycosyltransferase family 8 protein n=1 Tax=Vibrio algicola TaxID=2662262 RepID=A0A5Q0TBJ2_9VIBR|nr:glycosyltransferase family 8 protein [Vibrio algicola]